MGSFFWNTAMNSQIFQDRDQILWLMPQRPELTEFCFFSFQNFPSSTPGKGIFAWVESTYFWFLNIQYIKKSHKSDAYYFLSELPCSWLYIYICNAGDLGSIPGLERSPGEGNRYPLQYSGLENSMDCIFHGVAKSQTWLSDFHFIGYTFTCLSNRHISGKVFLTQFELMFPPLWFHGLISISLTHYLISHLDLRIFIPLLFLKIWVCLTGMILPYSLL